MTNEEILKNGPEGWTHYDSDGDYWMMNPEKQSCFWDDGFWELCEVQEPLRSRADIERIVELETMVYNGKWDE